MNSKGFSLIEVMIALVILTVGLAGVLGFSAFATVQARDNDKWTEARLIAESELEQRSSASMQAIQLILDSGYAQGISTVTRNYADYQVEYWYEEPTSNQFRITVRVNYSGLAAQPVSLSTEKNIFL